ncbi:MAG: peptide chain release factor N(5)-glutamine methyltransferase [Deltaproteobacteria bacterium]|nr:peptide chain release factor N(5)-glutamine methyltransferase [Deltaproteobacteria bacterium]
MSEQKPGSGRWEVLEVLKWTTERFTREGIESPRLDAEVLLAHVLEVERIRLYMDFDKPLAAPELAAYRDHVRRRLKREPVAYIVGEKEFWSLTFHVEQGVLIPRPETELLIEQALVWRKDAGQEHPHVVDVGTGSGAIAVTLAHEWPDAEVVAVDLEVQAAKLALRNAHRHDVGVRVVQGDLLSGFGADLFHLVVANLPYVRCGEAAQLPPEVGEFEPSVALFSGDDGLDAILRFLPQARSALVSGGMLLLEMDPGQIDEVAHALQAHGFIDVTRHADLAGLPRALSAHVA